MALSLVKITILVGAGIAGSVLAAKEGSVSTVSGFLSGAAKIAWRQLKDDSSTSPVKKPPNAALMSQVNSLRQELQLLSSNKPVTIITTSGTVLKGISDGLSRGKKLEEMEKLAMDLWKANMRHPHASEVINKDIISHFVLRLVYCGTEDLRRWFLSNETALFRYRFRLESAEAQRALITELGIPYKVVSNTEFKGMRGKLGQVGRSIGQPLTTADVVYYKVPFEEVPALVAGRRVFIHKGFAYVAENQVVSFVVAEFRSYLSKALIQTNRKLMPTIREQEKDRLAPIVEALSSSYLGPDCVEARESGETSIKDLEQLSKRSFPLCMSHLFEKLEEDHHLKCYGWMQLGLFLKGVGLKLDDALAFWKAEFSQKVAPERFDKEYKYRIRHNYGKEGKRTDYAPYSCQRIISDIPGVGEHHVCPYRHFSEENLRAALGKMGLSSREVEDVMDKKRSRHYQLACTLTFEAIHGASCDAGIHHPNQYSSDSRKILQAKVQQLPQNDVSSSGFEDINGFSEVAQSSANIRAPEDKVSAPPRVLVCSG